MKLAASQRGLSLTRRLGAVAVIGASLLGVSACSYIAPQQTTAVYAPSDGAQINLGDIQLRNILLVTSGRADQPGRMLGAIFNNSKAPVQVTFRGSDGAQIQITVSPDQPYYLNESNEASIMSTVSEPAGALETVSISQNSGSTPAQADLRVPVLDGTLEEYQKYVPGPAATPTSSASPSS